MQEVMVSCARSLGLPPRFFTSNELIFERPFALWRPGNAKTCILWGLVWVFCACVSCVEFECLGQMFNELLFGVAPWYRLYDLTWHWTLHMQRMIFLFKNTWFSAQPDSTARVRYCVTICIVWIQVLYCKVDWYTLYKIIYIYVPRDLYSCMS